MTAANQTTLTVGQGDAVREIAVLTRPGNPPGLFWLGGFASDMTGHKAVATDALAARRNLAMTRFDYSGHGQSGGRFEDGTISRWLEEARAVFERCTAGPQVLIGSSMGGWLALLLVDALRRISGSNAARVAGMVLVAPAVDMTRTLMWDGMSASQRAELETLGKLEIPSEYGDRPTLITRALIDDGEWHLFGDRLIETGCPIHILQGVRDPDVPWRHARDLVARLASDDVVLTLIKDGDHRLSRPQDIDRLTAAIDAMVADHS